MMDIARKVRFILGEYKFRDRILRNRNPKRNPLCYPNNKEDFSFVHQNHVD